MKNALLRRGGVQDAQVKPLRRLKHGDQAAEDHIDSFGGLVAWNFGLEEQQQME